VASHRRHGRGHRGWRGRYGHHSRREAGKIVRIPIYPLERTATTGRVEILDGLPVQCPGPLNAELAVARSGDARHAEPIEAFPQSWNAGATPFVWIRTADEILAKAVRKRPAINEPGH
jgi:hypothetical protein